VIHQQSALRLLLDGPRDALAVLRPEHEGPHDEEVERALQELHAFVFVVSGRHSTRMMHALG
jgi:hypothetical protein